MKNFGMYIIAALTIALIISISINIYYHNANTAPVQKSTGTKTQTNTSTKLVATKKDSLGHKHEQFQTQEPISKQDFIEQTQPSWADTAMRALDLGNKYKDQVQELTKVNITLKDSLLKAKVVITSTKSKLYFYENQFIKLTFQHGADTTDNGTFSYRYNANFTAATIFQRGFLGIFKKALIDISSTDRNFTINNLEHFQVEPPTPPVKFHVQVLGQYTWSPRNLEPGFGGQLDFGKTNISAGGFYNFITNKPELQITARHDLLTF